MFRPEPGRLLFFLSLALILSVATVSAKECYLQAPSSDLFNACSGSTIIQTNYTGGISEIRIPTDATQAKIDEFFGNMHTLQGNIDIVMIGNPLVTNIDLSHIAKLSLNYVNIRQNQNLKRINYGTYLKRDQPTAWLSVIENPELEKIEIAFQDGVPAETIFEGVVVHSNRKLADVEILKKFSAVADSTNLQNGPECEKMWFGNGDDLTRLIGCKAVYEGLEIVGNVTGDLGNTKIEEIRLGNYYIYGTNLKNLAFLYGTKTSKVSEIYKNPHLCDMHMIFEKRHPDSKIKANHNCVDTCYTSSEFQRNSKCKELYGDYDLKDLSDKSIPRKVHGWFTISDLQNDTIDHKAFDHIYAEDIMVKNLPNFCDFDGLRDQVYERTKHYPTRVRILFRNSCEKECHLWDEIGIKNCKIWRGDAGGFYKATSSEPFDEIEEIKGRLFIGRGSMRHLDLSKLKKVTYHGEGPAILIEENDLLQSIDLSNLETVISGKGPAIQIWDNNDLESIDLSSLTTVVSTAEHKMIIARNGEYLMPERGWKPLMKRTMFELRRDSIIYIEQKAASKSSEAPPSPALSFEGHWFNIYNFGFSLILICSILISGIIGHYAIKDIRETIKKRIKDEERVRKIRRDLQLDGDEAAAEAEVREILGEEASHKDEELKN